MKKNLSEQNVLEIGRRVVSLESRVVAALRDQIGSSFYQAVQMMLDCKGHILTTGAGTSHTVAARFAHLLSCCGTPALYIHPGDSQHGLSGAVRKEDIVFAVSKGGETFEVNNFAEIVKARGAQFISILENPDSTLGRLSDLVIVVKAPPESDVFGMISTGSSLFNAVLCDALCVAMLETRGYTRDQFGTTHPGGAVGIRLEQENNSV